MMAYIHLLAVVVKDVILHLLSCNITSTSYYTFMLSYDKTSYDSFRLQYPVNHRHLRHYTTRAFLQGRKNGLVYTVGAYPSFQENLGVRARLHVVHVQVVQVFDYTLLENAKLVKTR